MEWRQYMDQRVTPMKPFQVDWFDTLIVLTHVTYSVFHGWFNDIIYIFYQNQYDWNGIELLKQKIALTIWSTNVYTKILFLFEIHDCSRNNLFSGIVIMNLRLPSSFYRIELYNKPSNLLSWVKHELVGTICVPLILWNWKYLKVVDLAKTLNFVPKSISFWAKQLCSSG